MRRIVRLGVLMTIVVLFCSAQEAMRFAGHSSSLPDPAPRHPDTQAEAFLWEPFDVSTVAVQTAAGGGMAAALIISTLKNLKTTEGFGRKLTVSGNGLVGALLIAFGVHGVGELMGGDGDYGWTAAGALSLAGVSLFPALLSNTGNEEKFIPPAVIAGTIGAILGYHFFASPVPAGPNQTGAWLPVPEHIASQAIPYDINVRIAVVSIPL